MDKRGLSGIIVTVIIIGIALAVVGIGYFAIKNVAENAAEESQNKSSSLTEYIYGGWKESGVTGLATWTDDGEYIYCENCSVGIGTSSPSAELEVNGTIRADGSTSSYWGSLFMGTSDNFEIDAASASQIRIGRTTAQSVQIKPHVQIGTDFGGNPTNELHVVGNADISGNVGIGTTNPQDILDISPSSAHGGLYLKSGLNDVVGRFRVGDGGMVTIGSYTDHDTNFISGRNTYIAMDADNDTSNNFIAFTKDKYGYGGVELVRINENGNLGIGTNAPTEKLEVNGQVKISDTNTGSNAGSDLCIDSNNRICACGSCA